VFAAQAQATRATPSGVSVPATAPSDDDPHLSPERVAAWSRELFPDCIRPGDPIPAIIRLDD
jgi:hypothetical protein